MSFLPKARRLLRIRESDAERQAARDVDEEIRFHLESRTEELMAGHGLSRKEAAARARREFGDPAAARRALVGRAARTERRRRLGELASSLGRDFGYGWRQLRGNPVFAASGVLALGLGIGAASAIFSLVRPILLAPLPYERPERLVTVWNTYPGWQGHAVLGAYWDRVPLSWPEYRELGSATRTLENVAVFGETTAALTGSGDPVRLRVGLASSSLFPLLGVRPEAGRVFARGEDGPGAARLALLSHHLWRDRFGGDAPPLGRVLRLDGRPFTVIGVLPPGFRLPGTGPYDRAAPPRDLWIPVGADGASLNRDTHDYEGVARLAPGASVRSAEAQAAAVLRGGGEPGARGARVVLRREAERGDVREGLLLLAGAAGLLLLLACVNVATLQLGRVSERRGELATRAALGAGTGRLARQLVLESLLLGVLGAGVGLALAWAGRRLLLSLAPPELSLTASGSLDPWIFLFGGALGVATGIAFGCAPAWAARGVDLRGALAGSRNAGEAVAAGGGPARPRVPGRSLLATELALSLVLLVSTGLLARSLAARLAIDPGFDPDDLVTLRLSLPADRYPDSGAVSAGLSSLVARIAALPEIAAVSGTSALPLSGRGGSSSFEVEGREVPPDTKKPEAIRRAVLPGYHEALGIPVLAGRTFRHRDRDDAPRVAVVSRAMARRFWPAGGPLGEAILWDDLRWEVVGVVGDVLHRELGGEPRPAFYIPFDQLPGRRAITLVVRPERGATIAAPALRRAVWEVDGALPTDEIGTIAAVLSGATAAERYRTTLVSAFAASALLLTAVGIFGVTVRAVTSRTRELGIRLALGADRGRLVREAVRRELPALAAGLALGLAGAAAGTGALRGFLFGVEPFDATTWGAAAGGLGLVALATGWAAARRATGFDPVRAIRAE